jgi:hypothetical protein
LKLPVIVVSPETPNDVAEAVAILVVPRVDVPVTPNVVPTVAAPETPNDVDVAPAILVVPRVDVPVTPNVEPTVVAPVTPNVVETVALPSMVVDFKLAIFSSFD